MAQLVIDTATADPVGTRTAIYVTRQFSAGVTWVDPRRFRLLTCTRLITGAVDVTALYVAAYGPLVAGKQLAVRVRRIRSSGTTSSFTAATTTVLEF